MAQYEYQFLTEGSGSYINDLAAETISKHALCYFDPTGNGWLLADADAASTMPVVGISMAAIPTTRKGRFLLKGFIGDSAWTWTPNGIIYASTTAGALTQTPPAGAGDTVQAVGIARTSTIIWFDPAGFGGVGSGQEFSPETAIVGFNGNLSSAPNYFLADGVADEVQINAAIAYVGALGGGSVFLERGTYNLAATVTMSQDEIKLIGQGWDTSINGGVAATAITVTGARCIIRDLTVRTTPNQGNNYDGINITGSLCTVDNVRVNGSDRYGVSVEAFNIQVTNCYIFDTDLYGVNVSGGGDFSVINDNIIDTTGDDGVFINPNGENVTVTTNLIVNWTNQPIDDDSQSSVVQGNNAGGDVLNSNGSGFATIQDAIDDLVAGGWVEVPERTFNEAVTITGSDIILRGRGWDSVIDGGTTGTAVFVNGGDRVIIRDLQVKTDIGQGNVYDGVLIASNSTECRIENVFVNGSDNNGLSPEGANCVIERCYVFDPDGVGIAVNAQIFVIDCKIEQCGSVGINLFDSSDNSIISNNLIDTTGGDGIFIRPTCENCVVTDNRITGWTGEPIDDDSDTSVVADNNCGGDVMNSKGCAFATVQEAVDHLAGDGWVEVPDGTFPEAVTISDAEVLLRGRGWGSIINGAATGHAIEITAARCAVENIRVQTTAGGGNSYDGINTTGAYTRILNVRVEGSDRHGFFIGATGCNVSHCYVYDPDNNGISVDDSGDNSIINSNQTELVGGNDVDITANGDNCIVTSNRLIAGAINDLSGTSTVANNDTT